MILCEAKVARAKRKTAEPELFDDSAAASGDYTAQDIEVLEGLEPVRRRPGMYIGGTDDRALHHLAAEILDNAMDEAVAGHADRIEMSLSEDGTLTIADNGRGIPIDAHPKYKNKSALEVILTTLHSGGKFDGKVYQTSGGLHGVGLSVVNALAAHLRIEVARDKQLWAQDYEQGKPKGKLKKVKSVPNRRGTTVSFTPDPDIFGANAAFRGKRLHEMAKAKAYLFKGVEIRWSCDPAVAKAEDIPVRRRHPRLSARHTRGKTVGRRRHLLGQGRPERHRREGRMGGVLAGRWRRHGGVLLQHGADA